MRQFGRLIIEMLQDPVWQGIAVLLTILGFIWHFIDRRKTTQSPEGTVPSEGQSSQPGVQSPQFRWSWNYRKKYLQSLLHEHEVLAVQDLSLTKVEKNPDFVRVFVELRLSPRESEEQCRIWNYLGQSERQNLIILGGPGSGKTTLLKKIVLIFANTETRKKKQREENVVLSNYLPILIFLRNHISTIVNNNKVSLIDIIHDHLENLQKPPGPTPTHWFKKKLDEGSCLVMLDGLDEGGDPNHRQIVATWIRQQMTTYHGNRFIVTSRPAEYEETPVTDRDGVRILETCAFIPSQVEEFLNKWYEFYADNPDEIEAARRKAKSLLRHLRSSPDLAELSNNPLRLTMIAIVYGARDAIPRSRVELYKGICGVLLGNKHKHRLNDSYGSLSGLGADQKQVVLQELAYSMMMNTMKIMLYITPEDASAIITEPLAGVSGGSSTTGQVSQRLEIARTIRRLYHGMDPASSQYPDLVNKIEESLKKYDQLCRSMGVLRENDIDDIATRMNIPETEKPTGEGFLEMIEASTSLLRKRKDGNYEFAHRNLQEYLAATHIRERRLGDELVARIGEKDWRETILMYVAQTDSTGIINACLTDEHPSDDRLMLVIDCRDQTFKLDWRTQESREQKLVEWIEHGDPERRNHVASLLLERHLNHMVQIHERCFVGIRTITNTQYQLFLDQQYEQGEYHQPDHWIGMRFPSGCWDEPVVGMRPSDAIAFCEWLTQQKREREEYRYRLPRLDPDEMIGNTGHQRIFSWLHTQNSLAQPALLEGASSQADLTERLTSDWIALHELGIWYLMSQNHCPTFIQEVNNACDRMQQGGTLSNPDLENVRRRARECSSDSDTARERAGILPANDAEKVVQAINTALKDTLQLEHALNHPSADDLKMVCDLAHTLVTTLHTELAAIVANVTGVRVATIDDIPRQVREVCAPPHPSVSLADLKKESLIAASDGSLDLDHILHLANQNGIDVPYLVEALNRSPAPHGATQPEPQAHRLYARLCALAMVIKYMEASQPGQTGRLAIGARHEPRTEQKPRDTYLKIYSSLAILEERIRGNLSAFEGIRIVRERKS